VHYVDQRCIKILKSIHDKQKKRIININPQQVQDAEIKTNLRNMLLIHSVIK